MGGACVAQNNMMNKEKKVLTIQDISCFGQCSLTVALPIISACGVETAIIPSAVLSTHTGGFTGYTFRDLTDDIPKIYEHWQKEHIYFDAIYSGYLGSNEQIDYVLNIINGLMNPGGIAIIDPAMADHGKLYKGFDTDFVSSMRKLCTRADFMLPNLTEACFLSDIEYIDGIVDEDYVKNILSSLANICTGTIILKGIRFDEKNLTNIIYDTKSKKSDRYDTSFINYMSHGTGDIFASVFTGAMMRDKSIIQSVQIASDTVSDAINATIGDDKHRYGVKFEKIINRLVDRIWSE